MATRSNQVWGQGRRGIFTEDPVTYLSLLAFNGIFILVTEGLWNINLNYDRDLGTAHLSDKELPNSADNLGKLKTSGESDLHISE